MATFDSFTVNGPLEQIIGQYFYINNVQTYPSAYDYLLNFTFNTTAISPQDLATALSFKQDAVCTTVRTVFPNNYLTYQEQARATTSAAGLVAFVQSLSLPPEEGSSSEAS